MKVEKGTEKLKKGFASMVKGGVIMDVTNAEQAKIAEKAGAVAVMALERVPADIRAEGGVARMAAEEKIKEIMASVTIPVMAKCRIGHFSEAVILESLGVDMIDESEVLTQADPFYHIEKRKFTTPFVCGARELGEAARRIFEGAAMIRTKGEAGTGNVIEAVRHQRLISSAISKMKDLDDNSIHAVSRNFAGRYGEVSRKIHEGFGIMAQEIKDDEIIFGERTYKDVSDEIYKILKEVQKIQRLTVVNFAAGGIATPADAALMMVLGSDGVFVGSGIFKSEDPENRASAIVEAVAHYNEPELLKEASARLGSAMKGLEIGKLEQMLQERGV